MWRLEGDLELHAGARRHKAGRAVMPARVAELADALDLGSSTERYGGSNPPLRTNFALGANGGSAPQTVTSFPKAEDRDWLSGRPVQLGNSASPRTASRLTIPMSKPMTPAGTGTSAKALHGIAQSTR